MKFLDLNGLSQLVTFGNNSYVSSVIYDSTNHVINFKNANGSVISSIDASNFIKDGMVSSVTIDTPETGPNVGKSCLIVTFNTDSGKDPIEIPIENIFSSENYYTKTEIDDQLNDKQDTLVSGTNIKTINNQSIVGSGNINITADGCEVVSNKVTSLSSSSTDTQYPSAKAVYDELSAKVSLSDYESDEEVVAESLNDLNARITSVESNKQDTISDIETIRSNAAAGAAKVSNVQSDWNAASGDAQILNKPNLATVATSGDYGDLSNKPTIGNGMLMIQQNGSDVESFSANQTGTVYANITVPTDETVSEWGFTKNTGTYSKPSGGIPKTDLASTVQTSLDKADTALQSYTETDPVFSASAAAGISSVDISNWNNKVSNVQSDWNATTGDAVILNKPTIPAAVTESTVSGWGFTKNAGTITGVGSVTSGNVTVDSTPTTNSTNLVTSGGVKSELNKYVSKFTTVADYSVWNSDEEFGFSQWTPNSQGAPNTYGTSLNFRDVTSWYYRLMFGTDNRIRFYSGINTTNLTSRGMLAYLSDLSDYLPLTGGTVTGLLTISTSGYRNQAFINRTNAGSVLLGFSSQGTHWGSLGVSGQDVPVFEDTNGNVRTLWHAGNDGSGSGLDADLLDGKHNGDLYSNGLRDYNNGSTPARRIVGDISYSDAALHYHLATSSMTDAGRPGGDGYVLDFGWDSNGNWDSQLYIANSDASASSAGGRMKIRHHNGGTWSDWKTVAFTDSNVASATKLETSRKLWGQSFDGTGNVNGSLEVFSTGSNWTEGIRIHSADNLWCGIILCEKSNSGSTGTSANTWSIHNNEGTFGIYKNGSSTSASQYISNVNNTWRIGNGDIYSTGEIYVGSTRLAKITEIPTSLPASDVYSWAKASSKPSYSWSEITGKPSVAIQGDMNNFVHSGNEVTFVPSGYTGSVYLNYRTVGGTNGNITEYILGNGKGGALGTAIHTGNFQSQALSKSQVTTALGYTPPTSDTNTTYAAGTGITISGSNNAINVTYGSSANTACQGNDSRLSNARPASDVYAWAKASSKPSYQMSEISMTESYMTISSNTTIAPSYGNIMTYIITSNCTISPDEPCHFFISTSNTAPTISWANSVNFYGGTPPVIEANKLYEVDMLHEVETNKYQTIVVEVA